MEQEQMMKEALLLAKEAADAGEVPVGCVIVRSGEIVGRGRNRREEKQSTASHAEMEAIAEANARLGTWRLDDCELYVTLEPCPMCAGAILMSEPDRVIFGAYDKQAGCTGSVYCLPEDPAFMHPVACSGGLLKEECEAPLRAFFDEKRG